MDDSGVSRQPVADRDPGALPLGRGADHPVAVTHLRIHDIAAGGHPVVGVSRISADLPVKISRSDLDMGVAPPFRACQLLQQFLPEFRSVHWTVSGQR